VLLKVQTCSNLKQSDDDDDGIVLGMVYTSQCACVVLCCSGYGESVWSVEKLLLFVFLFYSEKNHIFQKWRIKELNLF
jgi:hypothetical protein